jgi:hypothetical protein
MPICGMGTSSSHSPASDFDLTRAFILAVMQTSSDNV